MASLAMHMAIAKVYCLNNQNTEYSEFLRGNLQPDLEVDKQLSHFSKTPENDTL